MKSVFNVVLLAVTFTSAIASAQFGQFETYKHLENKGVTAVVLDAGAEMSVVGFAKGKQMLGIVKVTPNNDPIDVNVGEVFDIEGPQTEGDVCSISGKLTFVKGGFKIEMPDAGTAFRGCEEAAILGSYKK